MDEKQTSKDEITEESKGIEGKEDAGDEPKAEKLEVIEGDIDVPDEDEEAAEEEGEKQEEEGAPDDSTSSFVEHDGRTLVL